MIIILKLFKTLFNWVIWLCILCILVSTILLIVGCSTKTQYKIKTEKVYIPVKCKVTKLPELPKLQSSVYHTLNDVLIYAEQLKVIVNNCATEIEVTTE